MSSFGLIAVQLHVKRLTMVTAVR